MRFFSGILFYKSNRKFFSCVCIAWYKHERGWENSRQLCKPSTSSRVSITVSNSPNPSRVYIRLCKHGKRFLLFNYVTDDCKVLFVSFPFLISFHSFISPLMQIHPLQLITETWCFIYPGSLLGIKMDSRFLSSPHLL